jgi:hypothetical protein
MNVCKPNPGRRSAYVWRAVVCAALAVLFLYNPFLAALSSHAHVTVCQPERHRATIGSSELEQFAQPSGKAVPLPDVEVGRIILQVEAPQVEQAPNDVVREEGAPPRTGFSQSLWMRPPPSV